MLGLKWGLQRREGRMLELGGGGEGEGNRGKW